MKKQEKKSKIWKVVKNHIYHNLKQYTIVSIFFLVGIAIGVLFMNHSTQETQQQIGSSITTFLDALKTGYKIDSVNLLKTIIGNHIIFAFLLWFMGCTVIGIPIVYGLLIWKGFSLGYTISTILYTLGTGKGIIFCFVTLFLQNVFIIPCILALAVSGVKLYSAIMKDKRRENIKLEMVRHTIFSVFILCILILSAFVEVYVSNYILSVSAQYL